MFLFFIVLVSSGALRLSLRSYLCVTVLLIFIFRRLRLYVHVMLSSVRKLLGLFYSALPYLMERKMQ